MAVVRVNRKRSRATSEGELEQVRKAEGELGAAMVSTGGVDPGTSSLLGSQPAEGTALAAPAVIPHAPPQGEEGAVPPGEMINMDVARMRGQDVLGRGSLRPRTVPMRRGQSAKAKPAAKQSAAGSASGLASLVLRVTLATVAIEWFFCEINLCLDCSSFSALVVVGAPVGCRVTECLGSNTS
eukprot:1977526-Amphidinium_carterae.1